MWEGGHGEHDGVSGPVEQSPETWAADRSESAGDRRWGEGHRHGGDPNVRPGYPACGDVLSDVLEAPRTLSNERETREDALHGKASSDGTPRPLDRIHTGST